ncbi:MAG: M48 family metalloprotease [Rhodothermales bacterium]
MYMRSIYPLLLVAVLVLEGCAVSTSPVTGNRRAYAYTWQEEIAIGRDADPQIVAQFGEYDDPDMARYVDSLGQALLEVSHLRRPGADPEWATTPFTFRVLDSPVVNAFALPGGFVYVTRGLMAHLENEAQLAVVLGHEIGHVAGRHGSKRAMNQMFGQAALLAGAVGGQALFGGNAAENVLNLGSGATQLLFLSYGRDDERESDDLGVEYASFLGYDASEGSEFFRTLRRLGEQAGQDLPSFLSTHPDPGEREQTIQRMAGEWAATMPTNKIVREPYLRRVDGVVWGEDPRQGFSRDGWFHHPQLAFQFPVPSGFQVINQPTQVVMIPESQEAYLVMTIESEHASARAASDAFRQQQGLTVVQAGLGQTNGLSGWVVVANATQENGQVLGIRAHFIDHGGRVYRFIGVTTQQQYPAYESIFAQSTNNFRPLTDPAILNIQPNRMQLATVRQPGAFRNVVPATLPPGTTAETMAIINQLNLDSMVSAGRLYKSLK